MGLSSYDFLTCAGDPAAVVGKTLKKTTFSMTFVFDSCCKTDDKVTQDVRRNRFFHFCDTCEEGRFVLSQQEQITKQYSCLCFSQIIQVGTS